MPRINAPTVAEHRAARRRALLDATRDLLAEYSGRAPRLSAVAARAGLPRSSIYEYFRNAEDLLLALAQEVLPNWSSRVTGAMAAATTPAERVLAYVAANLQLVCEGEHALATTLLELLPGEKVHTSTREMHQRMSTPLVAALDELGVTDPPAIAQLIGSVVLAAVRMIEAGAEPRATEQRVRELLGPFLLGGTGVRPAETGGTERA